MVCWKLVRDRVGEELARSGEARVLRVSGEELEALLRAKVVEEAMEFAESGRLEEAADLLDALVDWLRLRGVGLDRVEELRRRKRGERGGFLGGYVAVWSRDGPC